MSDVQIMDTAFVKYLKRLDYNTRVLYLKECFMSGGEMAYELAEWFGTYDLNELSQKLEDKK